MNRLLALAVGVFAMAEPPAIDAQTHPEEAGVRAAVEAYNRAFTTKDLAGVRNVGLDDVWENHLRPEVSEFENSTAEFTDVRISVAPEMALVLRQYRIQATMKGRPIDARGNETIVWVKRGGAWKVAHFHYSHPCPRPPAS